MIGQPADFIAIGWTCAFVISSAYGTLNEVFSNYEFTNGDCTLQLNESCYSNDKIKFHLHIKEEYFQPFLLDLNGSLPEGYNAIKPLKVLIHGFSSKSFVQGILDEYLKKGGFNVLVVDWEELSKKPCYLSAAVNTLQVGKCVGIAVARLRPQSTVHMVGFSLGAHVSSYASNFLRIHHGRPAHRITGLDPALPLYTTLKPELKLDSSDADFVDVIHTSAGFYGKLEPSGHSDFYVNQFAIQPGCFTASNPALCSHGRATELFAESISSRIGFHGTPCPSIWYFLIGYCSYSDSQKKTLLGEYADTKAKGIYFIKTRESPPYALG